MNETINPRLLRPGHKRWNNPRFAGGKFYFAILTGPVTLRARTTFKRAYDAELHAKRLLARWIRLYDAEEAAIIKDTIASLPPGIQGTDR